MRLGNAGSTLNVGAAAESDYQYPPVVVLDLADDPVVTDPVTPKAAEGTRQGSALVPGVFADRNPVVHKINDAPGNAPVESSELV